MPPYSPLSRASTSRDHRHRQRYGHVYPVRLRLKPARAYLYPVSAGSLDRNARR